MCTASTVKEVVTNAKEAIVNLEDQASLPEVTPIPDATEKSKIFTDSQKPTEIVQVDSTLTDESNQGLPLHTLDEILSRQVPIDTFEWSSTDPSVPVTLSRDDYIAGNITTGRLKQYDFPSAIFANSNFLSCKLDRFQYFRADVELEIKINANKFQQGMLLVAYNPYSHAVGKLRSASTATLPGVSSYVNKMINVKKDSSVTLRMPYIAPVDSFDLSNSDNQFCTAGIYVISQLLGPSDDEKVTVNVLARFLNTEYRVPSVVTIPRSLAQTRKQLQDCFPGYELVAIAQGREGKASGAWSSIANETAHIAGALSDVPVVGDVAKVVEWPARAAGKALAAFGLSKPQQYVQPNLMINIPGYNMATFEGKDASQMLASIPDNSVDSSLATNLTIDEMALEYIFSRPYITWRKRLNWTQTTNLTWVYNQPNTADNMEDGTICVGASSYPFLLYKYWRATIVYRIYIVKTQYHSGRMYVCYNPYSNTSSYEDNLQNCHGQMIDLSTPDGVDGDVDYWEFEVPYCSNKPYLSTHIGSDRNVHHTGSVCIFGVGQLRHPDTVSDHIEILIAKYFKDAHVAYPDTDVVAGPAVAASDAFDNWAEFILTGDYDFTKDDTQDILNLAIGSTQWNLNEGGDSYDITQAPPFYGNGEYTSKNFQVNFTGDSTVIVYITARILASVPVNVVLHGAIPMTTTTATQDDFNVADAPSLMAIAQSGEKRYGGNCKSSSLSSIGLTKGNPDLTRVTFGEYQKSLRSYIKRFDPVGTIISDNPSIAYSPSAFLSDDEYGARTIGDLLYIPETSLSRVSYIYRFFCGSTRTKFFPSGIGRYSAELIAVNQVDFGKSVLQQGMPRIEWSSITNSSGEVAIPYYYPLRMRPVGANWESKTQVPGVRYNVSDGMEGDIFEAAADDFSYFCLVGPPPMHYRQYDAPFAIPILNPYDDQGKYSRKVPKGLSTDRI
ncbi:hypothetical protein 1 [Wenzhou picorna-like virus 35]|uniref:hypothetical protein 1 n=1 Tax=Wenzhou picorna-like virus 35 TaxID=1923621 RepID=UPI00090A3FB0|nr:hypothetical protein 1 [Wenzhou picorna-like virus 35]APG78527.1 hypothetical protein 1 [Wenzhou picorna-like virus 35]